MFACYKSIMLSINLRAQGAPELRDRLGRMNREWSRACTSLQQWDANLRETLMRCQVRPNQQPPMVADQKSLLASRSMALCALLHEVLAPIFKVSNQ